MVGRDRLRDVLQQHGLAGARRRDDQRALAHADRRDDVDDARRQVLARRVLDLELQPAIGIERRQVVEMDLVADLLGVLEVDRVDLQQREIALALLGAADQAFDRVAGAQAEAADLRGRDVDVVGAGEVVGIGRAQEAEAVLQHLDDAFADDLDVARRELLEDREHQLLLAQGGGVLDLVFLGEDKERRRRLVLQLRELDLLGVRRGGGARGLFGSVRVFGDGVCHGNVSWVGRAGAAEVRDVSRDADANAERAGLTE